MAHQLQVTGSASFAFLGGSGNVITGADNLGDLSKITIGSNLTLTGGVLSAIGGGTGSVTSVAVSRSGDALSITGSPITTSGTINIGFSGNSGQYIDGSGNLTTFPSIITQAQNLVTEVYNETGATLTKGTVVYINGGHGNLPTITKAIATGDATSAQTYGVVRADITNMNNGYVTVFGNLDNMDTQAYPAGTQLYLSSTTAGAYTSVKQYAPAHLVYVGIVVRSHPTQGVIEIRIQNGFELDELHNVSAQSPNNGDILQYVSSTSLWTSVAGTTTNIAEGDNLYFTNARARGVLSTNVGSALTYNSTTGRFTLNAATALNDGYLTALDYADFDSKQASLGTGTTSQFLRGDLVWATPPMPSLEDLTDVDITSPTNGQLLRWQIDHWENWTLPASPVLSVFGRTGIVVATSGDYTTDQVTEATNLYYTNARARGSVSVDVGSALTYNSTTGRFSLPAADGGVAGYVTTTDYNYWDSKQDSLGTGTTSQYLRGDLTWSTPPAPALEDLTDVIITTPTNGQLLRYTAGNWINFTPTYVSLTALSATAPLSYNNTTGVFSISQATTSTNGYLSSTDWNTFNNKQSALTNPVTGSGTTNYIPKFTGASAIGNSIISESGTTISVSGALTSTGTITGNGVSIGASDIRSSSGTLTLGGSSEVVRLTSTSNVLIGTTTDAGYKLDVSGTGRFSGTLNASGILNTANDVNINKADSDSIYTGSQIWLSGTYTGIRSGTDHSFNIDTYNAAGGTRLNAFKILQSGAATFISSISFPNGSITSSGELALNVSSPGIYTYGRYAGTNGGRIFFNNGTGSNLFFGEVATHIYAFTGNSSTNTPILSMDGLNTRVGINTNTPDTLLTVNGVSGTKSFALINSSGGTRADFTITENDGLYINSNEGATNRNIIFQTGGTERMRISVGTVNINTSGLNSVNQLNVFGAQERVAQFMSGGDSTIIVGGTAADGASSGEQYITYQNGTTNTNAWMVGMDDGEDWRFAYGAQGEITDANTKIRLTQGGNLMIGTLTDSGYRLEVNGQVRATAFFESSDKRLKKEISDNPIINGICTIKPKLYIKDGKEEFGYYAQELQEVLPSSVNEGKDGFLSLSYTQVHTAKIAELENKIEQLEKLIKTLI